MYFKYFQAKNRVETPPSWRWRVPRRPVPRLCHPFSPLPRPLLGPSRRTRFFLRSLPRYAVARTLRRLANRQQPNNAKMRGRRPLQDWRASMGCCWDSCCNKLRELELNNNSWRWSRISSRWTARSTEARGERGDEGRDWGSRQRIRAFWHTYTQPFNDIIFAFLLKNKTLDIFYNIIFFHF